MLAHTRPDADPPSGATGLAHAPAARQKAPPQPALAHVVLAGGLAGVAADVALHPWDTIKTRLQGQHIMRYRGMVHAMRRMAAEERLRGFFGGLIPAAAGSLAATTVYFGTYESTKRWLLGLRDEPSSLFRIGTYLAAGSVGDVAASVLYVPSEVLKTRFQLQGRHSNQYSVSTFNYRSLSHAVRMIYLHGGVRAFYRGYAATLCRDVPFSALQFAFYELLRELLLRRREAELRELGRRGGGAGGGVTLDQNQSLLVGAAAGSLAGALTNPLDVVKTQLQTRKMAVPSVPFVGQPGSVGPPGPAVDPAAAASATAAASLSGNAVRRPATPSRLLGNPSAAGGASGGGAAAPQSAAAVKTPSVAEALRSIYHKHGARGFLWGIGPRTIWAGLQSALMFSAFEWGVHRLTERGSFF